MASRVAWMATAMPYVKLSLAVLKAAAIAGRLSGFPNPDIAGVIDSWIDEQLEALDGLKEEAIKSLSQHTKNHEASGLVLDQVDSYVARLSSLSTMEDGATVSAGQPFDERMAESLQNSVQALDQLLPQEWRQSACLSETSAGSWLS